jgi:hypothetical protein
MAGPVSKNAVNRWNNMASIVSGGGSGSRFVPGLYREPDCREGVYPARAAQTIASGATGNVVYQGRIYQATNQSGCQVSPGTPIGMCISPNCEMFFIGCPSVTPVQCCDNHLFLCVNGETLVFNLAFTNRIGFWIWDSCCDACGDSLGFGGRSQMYLWFSFNCDEVTDTIGYDWQLYCLITGAGFLNFELDRGSGTLSGWCVDPDWVEEVEIYPACPITITASMKIGTGGGRACGLVCDDGNPPPPEPKPDCCDKVLWFCINGESVQLAVNGGTYTWDVSDCCEGCASATLEIRVICNARIGIVLQWIFTCDGGGPESGVYPWGLNQFCTGGTFQIVTIDASCFMQMQITTGELNCDICDGVDTTCCDDVIPKVLQVVVVGGACAGTYELVWSAGTTWIATLPCTVIEFRCDTGDWLMSYEVGGFPIGLTRTSQQCEPFEVVFDGTLVGATSVTVTIP